MNNPYDLNNNNNNFQYITSPMIPSANQLINQDETIKDFNRLARALFSSDKRYITFKIKSKQKNYYCQILSGLGYDVSFLGESRDKKYVKLKISW